MKDKNDDTLSPAGADAPAGEDAKTDVEIWQEFQDEESKSATDELVADDDSEENTEDQPDLATDDDASKDDDDPDPDKDGDADDPEPDIEALQDHNARLEQKYKSAEGRAVGQQRRADGLAKELADLKKQISARNEKAGDDAGKDRSAAIASLREEYGDIANPLLDELASLRSQIGDPSEKDSRRVADIEGQLDQIEAEQLAILEEEHPDGLQLIKDNAEAFREWIEDQPKRYRDIYARNGENFIDGTGAALVVGRFKQAIRDAEDPGSDTTAPTEGQSETRTSESTRRQRQLEGARSTSSRSRQAALQEPLTGNGSREDDWKYFEMLDAKAAKARSRN